ncbi:MAG: hypothetical protein ACRCTZ_09275 [Sarcina sp.]
MSCRVVPYTKYALSWDGLEIYDKDEIRLSLISGDVLICKVFKITEDSIKVDSELLGLHEIVLDYIKDIALM